MNELYPSETPHDRYINLSKEEKQLIENKRLAYFHDIKFTLRHCLRIVKTEIKEVALDNVEAKSSQKFKLKPEHFRNDKVLFMPLVENQEFNCFFIDSKNNLNVIKVSKDDIKALEEERGLVDQFKREKESF